MLVAAHDGPGPRRIAAPIPRQNDVIYRVYLANAITLAYSAIEELGLEIRASEKKPSKMPDGTWNAPVQADIEARLRKSGIDHSRAAIWLLRGPKTHIEKLRPARDGKTELVARQRARCELEVDRRLGAGKLAAKQDNDTPLHWQHSKPDGVRRPQCRSVGVAP